MVKGEYTNVSYQSLAKPRAKFLTVLVMMNLYRLESSQSTLSFAQLHPSASLHIHEHRWIDWYSWVSIQASRLSTGYGG